MNERSADMYEFVSARESSARTYGRTFRRVFHSASGAVVTDTDGREYLDCLSAAGTLALGHNHPAVVAAVRDFLAAGVVQQGLDLATPAKYHFIRTLFDYLPAELAERSRVLFCGPTGADAVEAAIKLFKIATGRRTVIAFSGAYHGMTSTALALTGNLDAKKDVPGLAPDVHFMPYPYAYRCPFGIGADGYRTSLAYLDRTLGDPESGIPKPAAVIVEAVQGEGGVIPAPMEWLAGLRDITARHDVPLVIDEVQTGFGRTGASFGFAAAGIRPDAVVLSKAVGGGYPLSALVYDGRFDGWRPGAHRGTFRGNQIAMAAGVAVMETLIKEGLAEAAQAKGDYLAERLNSLAAAHSEVGDVRGAGLMWGLELVDPAAEPDGLGSRPADGARAAAVQQACLRRGLIVETGGRHGAVLRLLPPLTIEYGQLDRVVEIIGAALDEAAVPV